MLSRLSDTSAGSSDEYETDHYHPSDHDSDDAFLKSGKMPRAPPRTSTRTSPRRAARGRNNGGKVAIRSDGDSKNGSGGKTGAKTASGRVKPSAKKTEEDSYEGDDSSSDEEYVAKKQVPDKPKYAIGTAISKNFGGEMYSGKVIEYHPKEKHYSVRYDDGDEEDLSEHELDELAKNSGSGGGAKRIASGGGAKKPLTKKTQKKSGGETDSFSDNGPKKPAPRDFQSESDSDDDPFAHLGRGKSKRKQIHDDSDSDDESLSEDSSDKRKPSNKAQKKKAFSSDSENSDDELLMGRRTARKKNTSVHDSSSDSEVELLSPRKPAPRRSPRKSVGSRSNSKLDDYTDQDVKIHPSPKKKSSKSQQSTHDPSIRAETVSAWDYAKAARENLLKAQQYHAEDVEVKLPSPKRQSVDVLDVDDDSSVEVAAAPAPVQNAYNGDVIRLTLRYNKGSQVTLRIKMDEPLKLLNERLQSQCELSISSLAFDGQKLDMGKTPQFYEMEDEDLVDAVVQGNASARATTNNSSDIIKLHVRKNESTHEFGMPKTAPISKLIVACCAKFKVASVTLNYNGRSLDPLKSCQAEGIPNNASIDAVAMAMIPLEFRVNGNSNDVHSINAQQNGTFGPVMEAFAQKKSCALKDCKFIFDGEVLQPTTTLESLDLEGGEMIDVKLTESAAEAPPLHDDDGDVVMEEVEGVVISVKTARNLSKTRPKTWKLLNTNLISELKSEYINYYKPKGCKTVKFYFRNTLISQETKSLSDAGILDGDLIYAMENGKAYKSV